MTWFNVHTEVVPCSAGGRRLGGLVDTRAWFRCGDSEVKVLKRDDRLSAEILAIKVIGRSVKPNPRRPFSRESCPHSGYWRIGELSWALPLAGAVPYLLILLRVGTPIWRKLREHAQLSPTISCAS